MLRRTAEIEQAHIAAVAHLEHRLKTETHNSSERPATAVSSEQHDATAVSSEQHDAKLALRRLCADDSLQKNQRAETVAEIVGVNCDESQSDAALRNRHLTTELMSLRSVNSQLELSNQELQAELTLVRSKHRTDAAVAIDHEVHGRWMSSVSTETDLTLLDQPHDTTLLDQPHDTLAHAPSDGGSATGKPRSSECEQPQSLKSKFRSLRARTVEPSPLAQRVQQLRRGDGEQGSDTIRSMADKLICALPTQAPQAEVTYLS